MPSQKISWSNHVRLQNSVHILLTWAAAWWAWHPCRYPRSECLTPQSHRRTPANKQPINPLILQHFPWTYPFGQLNGRARIVLDLEVEDGEVESESETNGVGGLHVLDCQVEGFLIGLLRVRHHFCNSIQSFLLSSLMYSPPLTVLLLGRGDLSQVSVVVAFHLEVEDLRLGRLRWGYQVLVQQILEVHPFKSGSMKIHSLCFLYSSNFEQLYYC